MGNPTILFRKSLNRFWKCQDCGNTEEFEEDWFVEIIQDTKDRSQEINLVESLNLKCKKCGSTNIKEVEVN